MDVVQKTVVAGHRSITWLVYAADHAEVYWQVINPATGLGWQRRRDVTVFTGQLAILKALQAFNRLSHP